jgi:Uma2 family endonuclease
MNTSREPEASRFAAFRYSGPDDAGRIHRHHGEDGDNFRRHELIDGEVCQRPIPGSPHDIVKNNLKELFDRSGVDRNLCRCWIEHTFRMADFTIMTPDVAIVRTDRVIRHRGFTPGAPEIAVEVAVNDNSAVLQRKISTYLRNGAEAVCCIYPDLRRVVVYTAHKWRELTDADNLEFPALLPGLGIPVSALFEGI